MTIRGLFREFVVAKRRNAAEHEADKWRVWHTAALTRTEKMPKFSDFMRGNRAMTPQEMAAHARMLGEKFGTVRKFNPRKSRIVRPGR